MQPALEPQHAFHVITDTGRAALLEMFIMDENGEVEIPVVLH